MFSSVKSSWLSALVAGLALFGVGASASQAEVRVTTSNASDAESHNSQAIPLPAINDQAAKLNGIVVLRGMKDPNGADVEVLTDGKMPGGEDSPSENFFFAPGNKVGSIAIDLGKVIPVSEVATYSWHPQERGPQVYTLYGSDGKKEGFHWDKLASGKSPSDVGWLRIAKVDTRTPNGAGGFHASRIQDDKGTIGDYRYLLFDIEPSDARTPFGQTFFSEIDVLSKDADAPDRISLPEVQLIHFKSKDGKYTYVIDTTAAPELHDWSIEKLQPVILEWYPRIVEMLPSDGFEALHHVKLRYLPSEKMGGIPAYAQGGTISMNTGWFIREKNREAVGSVVHELVHVVQSYQARRPRSATPGWIVEGIPDYIRWFLYEPQTKGALLSPAALKNAKHDASYRVSGNFIDWVIRTYDKQGDLLQKLNGAAREGRYSSEVWKELTGKTEEQLAEEWKNQ